VSQEEINTTENISNVRVYALWQIRIHRHYTTSSLEGLGSIPCHCNPNLCGKYNANVNEHRFLHFVRWCDGF